MLKKLLLFALCGALLLPAAADDAEASELLARARAEYKDKDFYDAANYALDAEHMAESVEIKAQCVLLAVASFRKAELFYREFTNIEKLLSSYPSQVNFPALVDRQYELADKFYAGHRDPAYYALRWIPWLKDDDRSVEAYGKALEHAPYAAQAPEAKLRMAIRMLETGDDFEKPLEVLRGVIKDYPDTPQAYSAMLHLGVALASLAKYGDGDGAYNREAVQVLNEFKLKYPEASENAYVDKLILNTQDLQAKRLVKTADFYSENGRPDVAARYLSEVVRKYPASTSSDEAERKLAELDSTYIPQPVTPAIEERYPRYEAYPLPSTGGKLLITPQSSNHKYLLPIRDLGLSDKKVSVEEVVSDQPSPDNAGEDDENDYMAYAAEELQDADNKEIE